MYLLANVFPFLKRWRIPFNRDQIILLMVAFNELMLGVDTYMAHSISGNIKTFEWIPIIFGIISGGLLLLAGLVAIQRRMLANWIGSGVFLASVIVGVWGMYFHLNRDFLSNALPGSQWVMSLILYGPPLICPITFALVGWMGMSAAWQEDPIDSGLLHLWGNLKIKMPLSKTRAYFMITSLFMSVTLISSVLDHARTNFVNPWLWLPTIIGVFATLVTFSLGFFEEIKRSDLITFIVAMSLMVLVGLIGFVLHIERNLVHDGIFVGERFINGAPILAPLLFANMGGFGLLLLLDPKTSNESEPDRGQLTIPKK